MTHPVDWSKSGIKGQQQGTTKAKTGQEQNERIQGRVRYVSCVVTVRSCRVRGDRARGGTNEYERMLGVAVLARGRVLPRGIGAWPGRWNGAARGIAGKAVNERIQGRVRYVSCVVT